MFWSKPIYFKIDRLWFWWEKTHPKVKAVFWDTGPCLYNITGLQLVLSCPPSSDGKGKGQFISQGGWNGFQLAKAISNPNRHFQPLSCSGPGFVKTRAQMVKTSDSWECQINPPPTHTHTHTHTEQLETSKLQLRPSSGPSSGEKRWRYFYICDSAEL